MTTTTTQRPDPRDPVADAQQAAEAWVPPTWEEIVEQHSARVYRLAYRLTGNPHDAEDLTHDVFIRVFRSLHSYQPGTFEGWLHRITTNVFLDKMRRKQRIRFDALSDDAAARLPSRDAGPGAALRRHPLRRRRPARAGRPRARLPGRGRAVRHRGPVLRGDRRHPRRQARHGALADPPRPRPAARGPRAPRPSTRARTTSSRPARRRVRHRAGRAGDPVTAAGAASDRTAATWGRWSARTSTATWPARCPAAPVDRHVGVCGSCRAAVEEERRLMRSMRPGAGPETRGSSLQSALLGLADAPRTDDLPAAPARRAARCAGAAPLARAGRRAGRSGRRRLGRRGREPGTSPGSAPPVPCTPGSRLPASAATARGPQAPVRPLAGTARAWASCPAAAVLPAPAPGPRRGARSALAQRGAPAVDTITS